MLANVIPFDEGERKIGHNIIETYYAQHVLELLNPKNTPFNELRQAAPMETDQNIRNTLGGFLFSGDDIQKRISVLSGGEKARVALAKLLLQPSNLLLMDEPTNHLDIVSREILADALGDYHGTICFITHDRTLIRQVANKIVEIDGGHPTIYPGDYDGYLYRKEVETNTRNIEARGNGRTVFTKQPHRETDGYNNIVSAEEEERQALTKESHRLAKRIEYVTASLDDYEARIAELDTIFADSQLYDDPDRVATLGKQYRTLKTEAEALWEEWERLSLDAETIDADLARLRVG